MLTHPGDWHSRMAAHSLHHQKQMHVSQRWNYDACCSRRIWSYFDWIEFTQANLDLRSVQNSILDNTSVGQLADCFLSGLSAFLL